LTSPAFAHNPTLTNDQIRERIIQQSVADYHATGHPCACPYDLERNGRDVRSRERLQPTWRRGADVLRAGCDRRDGDGLAAAERAVIEWDQERDPFRKAAWLLERSTYLPGVAEALVTKCLQEAADTHDRDGVVHWNLVLDAIEVLRRQNPAEGEAVH
jgi:hypothetical protein